MTAEQRVGQLLLVSFDRTDVDDDLREMVGRWGVGGVVFYENNVRSAGQTRRLIRVIRRLAGEATPPFVAVDQEGGTVLRLKSVLPRLPGNMALGAAGSPELAERAGAAVGGDLRRLGFTMNLGPVLDVYSNPASAIGTRSFGEGAVLVGRLGAAFIRGEVQAGVIAVGKHFIAEGAASGDSHQSTPWVAADAETLRSRDALPFRMGIEAGLPVIMTSFVAVPAVTGEGAAPATLSSALVTGLLRKEIGFGGVVVTDALEMRVRFDRHDLGEIAVEAIEAGADMVLTAGDRRQRNAVYRRLCEAYRTGRLPEERVHASLRRVLALKDRYGAAPHTLPLDESVADAIASRAVTLVRDGEAIARLRKAGEGVVCIAPDRLLPHLLGARALLIERRIDYEQEPARAAEIIRALQRRRPRVIVAAFTNRRQAEVLRRVIEAYPDTPSITVSLGNPHDLETMPAAAAIAAYSAAPASQRAVASVLRGRAQALGKLPIRVEVSSPTASKQSRSVNANQERGRWQ